MRPRVTRQQREDLPRVNRQELELETPVAPLLMGFALQGRRRQQCGLEIVERLPLEVDGLTV